MPSVPSISFNVRYNLTSAPTLVLTDTTTYPVGAIGIFTITQPDGYVRTGNFSSPDISSSGGTLSTPLRLSSTGGVQCGTYTIKYEIRTTDLVISTFTREFIFTYVPVSLNLKENFDVFTPSLSYSDMTLYGVNNYSNTAPTRAWTAVSIPTGTKTANTSTISLQHNGRFYDAVYTITLASTLTYQHTTFAWLSVLETVSKTVVAEACTPEPLEDLVAMMETLRQNSINCAGDLPIFEKAQSLFSHLMDQVKMALLNNIPQDGIYDTYEDLMAILRNGQPCVHTNLPIDPYDLGDYAVSPYPIDLSYCVMVGNGSSTSYTVNHKLNDDCVIVQVYEVVNGAQVLCDVNVSDNNNVVVSFSAAPTTNQYKVVVYAGARGQIGPGVAAGGGIGQFLVKGSLADYETQWITPSFVSNVRTLTINGLTQDLTADRTWTIDTLYNNNGALTSNRTVTMGAFTLSFEKDVNVNGLTVGKGSGNLLGNTFLGIITASSISGLGLNTLIGYNVGGAFTTANTNTLIGSNSGNAITTGNANIIIGTTSGHTISTTSGNIVIGNLAYRTGTGATNVVIGNAACNGAGTGNDNVYIGANTAQFVTSGANNVTLGRLSARGTGLLTINNSTFLGYGANPLGDNQTNQIVIGYNAVGLGSNTTVIGNSSTTSTWLGGNLLLGSTTDTGLAKLQVTGAIQQSSVLSSLLKTDGSGVLVAATLGTDYSVLPSQSGNTGKFLTTDGSALSWADVVSGVSSFNTRTGSVTLNSTDVTTALGYTPYNSTNPSGYITGISSGDVTTALGYTPYNSSNPSNYISGINSGMVTTALGYTPVTNARTLTINGVTQDLSADRSFTVSSANIYTADGTLTGNRVVTMGANSLQFSGSVFNSRIFSTGRFSINRASSPLGLMHIQKPADSTEAHLFLNTPFPSSTPTSIVFQNNDFTSTGVGTGTFSWNTNGTGFNLSTQLTIDSGSLNISAGNVQVPQGFGYYFGGGEYIKHSGAAGGYHIDVYTNVGTPRVRFANSGRVLIGTTTESTFLLDVNGTARVSGDVDSKGYFATGGSTGKASGSYTILDFQSTYGRVGVYNYTSNAWLPLSISSQLILGSSSTARTEQLVGTTAGFTGVVSLAATTTLFGPNNNSIFAPATYSDANFPAIENNSFGLLAGNGGISNSLYLAGTKINIQIGTGTNSKIAQFSPTSGNLILQGGGTFTDAGFRLDVQGTARVSGALTTGNLIFGENTSSIPASLQNTNKSMFLWNLSGGGGEMNLVINSVTNTAGLNIYRYSNAGVATQLAGIYGSTTRFYTNAVIFDGTGTFNGNLITNSGVLRGGLFYAEGNATGVVTGVNGTQISWNRSGGDGETNYIALVQNNTGRAGDIEYGKYVNSTTTYTSYGGWKGNGNFIIGGTTDAGFKLDVQGTARVSGLAYVDSYLHAGGTNQMRIGASGGERSIYSSGDFYIIAQNTSVSQLTSSYFRYRRRIAITNDALTAEYLSLKTGYTTGVPSSSYATELLSSLQGGDTDNNFVIRNADQSFNSSFTQNIFLYAGLNTNTGGRYGKLVLQHDGTNTRGNVLIGTTTDVASSKLTIESTTQGFLPPRMTASQRTSIASPAVGLIVYQTDSTEGTYEFTSGGWRIINGAGGGSGTVTTLSVVSANGFAGTVANATTTPAITLSTTVTGLLKGNGTAFSAAVAGTDYLTPADEDYSVTSQTSNYTESVTRGTKIIKCDTTGGAFTVTLPTAVGNKALLIIKKVAGSGALTIDGNSSETIDGGTTATIIKVYESITLISDNSNWQIV